MRLQAFRPREDARALRAVRREGRARIRAIVRTGTPADRVALAIASTLFSGFLPLGGVWGSVAGVAMAAALPDPLASGCALLAVTLAGTWATARVRRAGGVDDPSEVTIDEVAGGALAGLLSGLDGFALFLPLALFCLFDAVKPLPANLLDRRGGALGVIGDDLVAGAYAGLLARALASLAAVALRLPSA